MLGDVCGMARQVLVIVAASYLDAVTFQICSQSFKIMPTALFAVWLLGQRLAPLQWGSLPVLAVGVIFVTLNSNGPPAGGTAASAAAGQSDLALGLAASSLSGLSSAYAGAPYKPFCSAARIIGLHTHDEFRKDLCLPYGRHSLSSSQLSE